MEEILSLSKVIKVSYAELKEENEKMKSAGKNPAEFERVLLGITKASLSYRFIYFRLHLSKRLQEY
jgi:hypothetical protein